MRISCELNHPAVEPGRRWWSVKVRRLWRNNPFFCWGGLWFIGEKPYNLYTVDLVNHRHKGCASKRQLAKNLFTSSRATKVIFTCCCFSSVWILSPLAQSIALSLQLGCFSGPKGGWRDEGYNDDDQNVLVAGNEEKEPEEESIMFSFYASENAVQEFKKWQGEKEEEE